MTYLTENQRKLIEETKRVSALLKTREVVSMYDELLNLIELQGKTIAKAVEQRDAHIGEPDSLWGNSESSKAKFNQELRKIMGGKK